MGEPDRAERPAEPSASAAPATGRGRRARGTSRVFRRDGVALAVLWVALGSVVAEFALRARDYIHTDSLRYQRLAISIERTHSLIPRINGVDIHSYSQLYPILIAPFFAHGLIVDNMRNVNLVGAFVMSSACIPAFLLTRRVTRERWAPYLVAALTVCMPWIVTAMFMMTEIASYPASAWAVYAMVVAVAVPSRKHDALALLAIAVGYFARGALIGFVIVLPLALVVFELGRASGGAAGSRVVAAARSIVRNHPILVVGYAAVAVVALTLYLQQRLSSVLGIYSAYENSAHLDYGGLPRAIVEHLATFSLAFGVVPFVIALAWIGANVVRPPSDPAVHAFACVGACLAVVLFVQATNFDLLVALYVHDRFLMYFVPVVLIGTVLAVTDARAPRWSLVVPLVLVVAGFALGEIPRFTWDQFVWLDLDSPISTVYRVLARHLGGLTPSRIVLIVVAVAGAGVFVLGARTLRPRVLAVATLGFLTVGMVLTTWAVFDRTFNALDPNLRPVTQSQHGRFDWIDQRVGPESSVTAIMYPISSDWFVNAQRWVDFVYFNKSIQRFGRIANLEAFEYLGIWFPKLDLHLDPRTGVVAESPTRWVLGSEKESRFRIAGPAIAAAENGVLIDAGTRWRLAWRSLGLYDDGWTRPGVPVHVRVYPRTGQRKPELRSLSFVLRAPDDVARREATLSAQGKTIHAVVSPGSQTQSIQVCVPVEGYADVRLDVRGSSSIPGGLATLEQSKLPRRGGIFVAALGEADEIGGLC